MLGLGQLRFSARLVAFATCLIALSVLISTAIAYQFKRQSLEKALGDELLAVVNAATPQINADLHQLVRRGADGGIEGREEFDEIRQHLLAIERQTGLSHAGHSALYTLRASPTVPGQRPTMEFVVMTQPGPDGKFYPGNVLLAEPHQLAAWTAGAARARGIYEDAEGIWISACAPLKNSAGSVVGLVQADRPVNFFHAEVRSQTGALLLGALASIAVAAALAIVFARRVVKPLHALNAATQRVARGELDHQLEVGRQDEFGELARSFNAMTEGLRERDRVKSVFKRYLPGDVVDYLLHTPGALKPGGERRCLTVLFSDLQGFTAFTERVEPDMVVALLNAYLGRVSERISACGGTLDKYLGDGVMAFFGAPVPRPDHPARACRAALAHLRVIDDLRASWRLGPFPELDVRVGLHCGDLILGNIGGEQSQDYTVIGDTVNLAARLESANKLYGTRILISEAVWSQTAGEFLGRELDLLQVKGRTQAVRVFELLGPTAEYPAEHPLHAVLAAFARGLAAYRAKQFGEAGENFQEALRLRPEDGPARAYLQRVEEMLATGAPSEWDTVWIMKDK